MARDIFHVTEKQYPKLWMLLDMTSAANNAGAGHQSYSVLAEYATILPQIEAEVSKMSPGLMDTFSDGEETEVQAIADTSEWLKAAHELLNEWFDAGLPCDGQYGVAT